MHDWGTIITALGTLIGTLSVAYNTFCNNRKDTFAQTINELKSEIDQKQKDAEIYRGKWLDAERGNEDLRKKITRLENQISKLKKKKEDEDGHERSN